MEEFIVYKLVDFTNNGVLLIKARHVSSISYIENTWNGHDVLNVAVVFVSGNRELITVSNTHNNKELLNEIISE